MAFHSNGRARPRPAWLPRGDDVHRPAGGSGDGGGGGLGQLSPGEPSGRPVGRQDRPDARGRVARLQTPKDVVAQRRDTVASESCSIFCWCFLVVIGSSEQWHKNHLLL